MHRSMLWLGLITGVPLFGGAGRRASPALVDPSNTIGVMATTTANTFTAVPATVSFTATDPDTGSVPGTSPVTVSWTTSGGSRTRTWALTVSSSSTTFQSCPTVPVNAVTVTCSGPTNPRETGTIACNPAFTLAASPQQVAGGQEDGGRNRTMSVTLNFTLADSWSYIAELTPPCTLNLTYTLNAP
jgi:hypothetical protein